MQRVTRMLAPLGIALGLILALMLVMAQPVYADTYTVTQITDDGNVSTSGTLSWAIDQANNHAGADTINFNLTSGSTVTITGALPALTEGNTTIQGSTGDTPAIQIVASGAVATGSYSGLRLRSANNTIRGLAIGGFGGFGITISGTNATTNTIVGCYVGTNLQGTEPITIGTDTATNGDGILIYNGASANNVYSSTVSGNLRNGIHIIGGGNNEIRWSNVGVDAAGTGRIALKDVPLFGPDLKGNGKDGIKIEDSDNNLIQDNIVSANYRTGIFLHDSDGNEIYGNKIGTGATGSEHMRNGYQWVGLLAGTTDTGDGGLYIGGDTGSQNNVIGGSGALANQIYFNVVGLRLVKEGTQGNQVVGNTFLQNERYGVVNQKTHGNTTHTTPANGDNLIESNVISGTSSTLTGYGVGIVNVGASPFITGNQVYNSHSFGIGNFPDFGTDITPGGAADDLLSMPRVVGNRIDGNGQEGIFSRDTAPLNRYTLHTENNIGNNSGQPDVAQRWIGAVEVYTGTTRIASGIAVTITGAGSCACLPASDCPGDVYDSGAWGPTGFKYDETFTETTKGTTWFQITEFEVSASGNFVTYTHLVQVGGDHVGAAIFSFDGISTTHPVTQDLGLPSHIRTGITSQITQTLDRYQVAQVTVVNPDGDSDGDGIPNNEEGAGDADGDGTPNYLDDDSDGDTISDATEGTGDPDGDGTPNFLDDDSDGDTILDAVEGAGDADGDGTPNFLDDDSDGDGVLDATEGTGDSDGDGTPDFLDADDDGDGIPTAEEDLDGDGDPTNDDADGDGTPNYLDADSNNNGIPDSYESGLDADGDGDVDADDCPYDPGSGLCGDSDGDGIMDWLDPDFPANDADSDGTPDALDTDADGDGQSDSCEDNPPPVYAPDQDCDGIPDYLDTDNDNDGISDHEELNAGTTDNPECPGGAPAVDNDGDGTPDCLQTDTDGDGIPDYMDPDADGDNNNDCAGLYPDADCDTIPNHLDTDSDGDGTLDKDEGTGDDDSDGVPNFLDPQYYIYLPLALRNSTS